MTDNNNDKTIDINKFSPKTDYANSPCLFELADYNKYSQLFADVQMLSCIIW